MELRGSVPVVSITPEAYQKLVVIHDKANGKVGVVGYVLHVKNKMIVVDVVIPEQHSDYTGVEFDKGAINSLITECEADNEFINFIAITSKSSVSEIKDDDLTTYKKMLLMSGDEGLRLIACHIGKDEEIKISVVDYDSNIIFSNMDWEIYTEHLADPKEIEEELKTYRKVKPYSSGTSNYSSSKTSTQDIYPKEPKEKSELNKKNLAISVIV